MRVKAKRTDVDTYNVLRMTALHEASFCGKAEIVTLLIKNGANVNKKDIPGRTPLGIAKKKRHQHVAEILQAAGGKE